MVIIITIKSIIAGARLDILLIKVCHSLANAPIIIIINNNVDIFAAIGSNEFAKALNLERTSIPNKTGSAVIKNMVRHKEIRFNSGALTPMKCCIEKPVINGRVITVKMLITAVYDIDNAVSPLANFVIMFEVTPPGHDANIITPTAISSVNPNIEIMMNATIGSRSIWFIIPTKKALGA
tara:strand:+ start:70 stop:609 length:540 start_codon:yes stop_codon:yes gene_type:complete